MTKKLSPRQSLFVQHYVLGKSAAEAARLAGYAEGYCKKGAHEIPKSPLVRTAIEDAQARLAEETEYTAKAAVAELDRLIDEARQAKQFTAVANLMQHKLKLHGLLIERVAQLTGNIDITGALEDAKARVLVGMLRGNLGELNASTGQKN